MPTSIIHHAAIPASGQEATEAFLRLLWKDPGQEAYGVLEMPGKRPADGRLPLNDPQYKRVPGRLPQFTDFRLAQDLYFCPALFKPGAPKVKANRELRETGRAEGYVLGTWVVWMDYDSPTTLPELLKSLPLAPSVVVESSPGKFHVYWLLSEFIQGIATIREMNFAILANTLGNGADKSGLDAGQILRLPAGKNTKPEYKNAFNPSVVLWSPETVYAAEDIMSLPHDTSPRAAWRVGTNNLDADTTLTGEIVEIPEGLSAKLRNYLENGEGTEDQKQSGAIYAVVSRLWELGTDPQDIANLIHQSPLFEHYVRWHERNAEHELEKDVKRIIRKLPQKEEFQLRLTKDPGMNDGTYDDNNLSDAHLGPRVAAQYLEGRFRSWGKSGWARWDGKRWAIKCTETEVLEAVRQALIDIHRLEVQLADRKRDGVFSRAEKVTDADEAKGIRKSATDQHSDRMRALNGLFNVGKMSAVLRVARGRVFSSLEDYDNQPDYLNVDNGVVHLPTGELRPHDPKLLFTKVGPTAYVPGATHPDWDKALLAIPEDIRDWVQMRFGQAATGFMVSDDVLIIFIGGGANGKTTVLVGINNALGDFSTLVSDRALFGRPGDHPTEVMVLKGARFAYIEELGQNQELSEKTLKNLQGSEGITARYIGQDSTTWDATHSMFINTNNKPRVDATDYGTWRRLALVNFPYTFDGNDPEHPADPTLRDRVKHDPKVHEAALAWIVEGAKAWYAAGKVFPPQPSRVQKDTLDWKAESNPAIKFLNENFEPDETSAVKTTDMFTEFTRWCADNGKRKFRDQVFWSRVAQHDWFRSGEVTKTKNPVRTSGWDVWNPMGETLPEAARLVTGIRPIED